MRSLAPRTLVLLVAVLLAAPAFAQTSDDLFAPGALHDVRLFMNTRDLEQLRASFEENTFYQADIEWRGVRVRSVAVRSRGFGSRNPTKPGLLVDIDRYVGGQRFLGLSELVLDNVWQDPSLVRESVTMGLFARMGQPAPRESYARLFINDTYAGVYALVEAVDEAFLARTFGDPGGYVFEYQWLDEFNGGYLGDSLGPYKERFDAETHTLEDDRTLYAPIQELFREINRPVSGAWRESVERYVDVPGLLTHLAVERFVSEVDGVLGAWAMNNFYLYRPAGSTKHHWIPWDRDNAFREGVEGSVLTFVNDNELVRRLLEQPDLREFYLRALEAVAGAASGWLDAEIAARAGLIRAAAYADPVKPGSNEQFEAEVAQLRDFAQRRAGIVLAEVARLRGQ
jgi:spore coat protein CotH